MFLRAARGEGATASVEAMLRKKRCYGRSVAVAEVWLWQKLGYGRSAVATAEKKNGASGEAGLAAGCLRVSR